MRGLPVAKEMRGRSVRDRMTKLLCSTVKSPLVQIAALHPLLLRKEACALNRPLS